MNLYQFINTVKQIVLAHKDVNTFNEGDVYEIMNSGQHTYPATVLTINNITTNEQTHYQTINCVLFYIDRLTDDYSNKTMIMSQGFNVLKQIKDKAVESLNWSFETANYTPYTEKFGDLCAGVYLECTIELEDDIICSDTSYVSQQLNVTRNGLYSTIGYDTVLVSVPDPELEELSVTANGTYTPTKYGYSKVDVNVPMYGTKLTDLTILSESRWKTVPNYDFSEITDLFKMFQNCKQLEELPLINANMKKIISIRDMCGGCSALKTIAQLDISNIQDAGYAFYGCSSLETVPQLDASSVKEMYGMFINCPSLTNFGGLKNIGKAFVNEQIYDLYKSSKLSDESIQNIINGLYDMTTKGFSPTLKFHSTVYAKLTDEQKTQITNKNWTVAS